MLDEKIHAEERNGEGTDERDVANRYGTDSAFGVVEGGKELSAVGIMDWPAFLVARTNTTAVSS
jgi:hypothetical protein